VSVYILYCETPHGIDASAISSQCPDAYRHEVAVDLQALQQLGSAVPQLNPTDVAQAFGIGFGVVVLFFLVGRGVGEVLRLIRHG
jgi:hypothetical protein